jgi:hypothetical protein
MAKRATMKLNSVVYNVAGPFMDQSVPPNRVPAGACSELVGVDGRFQGCLRKFYGMKKVLDLDDVTLMHNIDTYDGPSFIQAVQFRKLGTANTYRGFVVRWDADGDNNDEIVDLVWTTDNGATWAKENIFAGGSNISSTTPMMCETYDGFLYVAVEGKATQTIYWDGADLAVVDMGPGVYSEELAVPEVAIAEEADSTFYLRGNGRYQVAYRFYDSTRGVYSAMSEQLTVDLDTFKETKATATVTLADTVSDGDTITINSRVYEFDTNSSTTGDVDIDINGIGTVAGQVQAAVDAINGDSSAVVSARAGSSTIYLESLIRGSAGNAYTLAKSGTNLSVSSATLVGGGTVTTEPVENMKQRIDFAAATSIVSGGSTDFLTDFDKVDIFRSIDIGPSSSVQGAILYLEKTIDMPADAGAWNALTTYIGSVVDEALVFFDAYDSEKDIVTSPPNSGTIKRYQGVTLMMGEDGTVDQYNMYHSSPQNTSPEYFTTFNRRKSEIDEGRVINVLRAGDSAFAMTPNAVIHIYKSSNLRPLQFVTLHKDRGLAGKYAAHSVGNSIFLLSTLGLTMLNGHDGSMGQVSTVDRKLFDDWAGDWSTIKSAYDSKMNASFFLHPADKEIIQVYHSTQSTSLLQGANFVDVTQGPDIATGEETRAYFITATGLIVTPDDTKTGSGTMWGISDSYSFNGTITSVASDSVFIDSGATFHDDMVGALVYMTSGANAGEYRTIDSQLAGVQLTVDSDWDTTPSVGDTYAVSPVPFKAHLWRLFVPQPDRPVSTFQRYIITALACNWRKTSGFGSNDNNFWRTGAFRDGGTSIESATDTVTMDENPADSVAAFTVDGVDLEPYIEQIASGVSFELTNVEVFTTMTGSRKVT